MRVYRSQWLVATLVVLGAALGGCAQGGASAVTEGAGAGVANGARGGGATSAGGAGTGAAASGGAGGDGTGGEALGGAGGEAPSHRKPASGEVIFTELMPDPAGPSDFDAEWVELLSLSTDTLNLEGCRLRDAGTNADDHLIEGPVVIAAGEVLIFAKSASALVNGNLPPVAHAFGDGFSLTNAGDEVRLECDGALVDQVVYTSAWPFAAGVAMQLRPVAQSASANDVQANWCAATTAYFESELGTPGTLNGHCP